VEEEGTAEDNMDEEIEEERTKRRIREVEEKLKKGKGKKTE
jgi:hypothetical protein